MPEIELLHCPRCGREVRVTLSDAGHQDDAQANIPDTRYVCLDFGEECEGRDGGEGRAAAEDRCPVFGVRPVVMGIERARAGLTPEPVATIRAPCQGCGAETTQERVGSEYSLCGICGTTNVLSPGGA